MARFSASLASLFLVFGITFAVAQEQEPVPKDMPAPKADAPKDDPDKKVAEDFDKLEAEAKAKAEAKGLPGMSKLPVPTGKIDDGKPIPAHFVVMPGFIGFNELMNLKQGHAITRYILPGKQGFGTVGSPGMHIMPLTDTHVVIVMDEGVKGILGYSTPSGKANPPFVDINVYRDREKPSQEEMKGTRSTKAQSMIDGVMKRFDIPPVGSDNYRWYQPLFGSPDELQFSHSERYQHGLRVALPMLKARAQEITGIMLDSTAPPVIQEAAPRAATKKGRGRTTTKKAAPKAAPVPKDEAPKAEPKDQD